MDYDYSAAAVTYCCQDVVFACFAIRLLKAIYMSEAEKLSRIQISIRVAKFLDLFNSLSYVLTGGLLTLV
jgi:hypothetical protein